MPSGSKKRKAAKKKREKGSEINTNPSTTNPQGNDEVKSQDEKGSDGGEHDHPFNEEEEEMDPSAAQPSHAAAASSKDLDKVPGDGKIDETEGGGKEGVVEIEWDTKSEGSETKDVSVGHVEAVKESDHRNGNSGSSRSSDEHGTVKNTKGVSHNSVNETAAFDELVKSMDAFHAKFTTVPRKDLVVESSAGAVKVVASVPEVQSIGNGNALLEKPTGSQIEATDPAMEKNEDKEHSSSSKNVRTISLEEPKPRESDTEVSASLSQGSTPIPESTIRAEHVKDSDTPECSANQPLLGSVPPVVQKASWLSCCGLCDVLSGSNR